MRTQRADTLPTLTRIDNIGHEKHLDIHRTRPIEVGSAKKSKESFIDVINHLTEKRSILKLAGILTKSESKEMLAEGE